MVNISQVFLTDNDDKLPKLFVDASNSVKKNLIHTDYHLYGKEELQEFIKEHFPNEVKKSFDKLKPYALKKDLANYCLAYIKGGWFIDFVADFSIFRKFVGYNFVQLKIVSK